MLQVKAFKYLSGESVCAPTLWYVWEPISFDAIHHYSIGLVMTMNPGDKTINPVADQGISACRACPGVCRKG
jgi:hypothetical protein